MYPYWTLNLMAEEEDSNLGSTRAALVGTRWFATPEALKSRNLRFTA